MIDQESTFDEGWIQERLSKAIAGISSEADGVEAVFLGDETSHLRLAESDIIEADQITEGRVFVRAIVGKSQAHAVTSDLTDQGLRACARVALDRVPPAQTGRDAAVLPAAADITLPGPQSLDASTAFLRAEEKARWLSPALRAHRRDGLVLAGRFHSGLSTLAVQSTAGVSAHHQGSWANLSLSALERPAGHRASAYRAHFDARVDEETVNRLQEDVRAECHRAHDPVEIEPQAYDIVLAPAAVAELLEWFGAIAFGSRSLEDGLSFVDGNVGERVTASAINIYDDASMPHGNGVSLPFDVEGQPNRHVALVEAGVARGIVHDSLTGRRHGCGSTGHAQLPSDFSGTGSKPAHLHFGRGTATVEDLIGQVDRGLFITRLHYVNGMIDPRRAVMTGLTRDAAFLIEGGKLTRAIAPIRFTDGMLEAFGRVHGPEAISRVSQAHGSWFGSQHCTVAPYVLIPGLRFTSGR